jgi:glutamate carboxypeptidase
MQTANFRAECDRQLSGALEFLRRQVAINSFTTNVEGVNAVGVSAAEAFAPLGFEAVRVAALTGADHFFLSTPFRDDRPTLALVSHLDTVFPAEEERRNDFFWREEGRRIYGPGTNDIKGGTALILLMLRAWRMVDAGGFSAVNWVIALNACEETDSADFGGACRRMLPPDTRAGLIFEADGGGDEGWSVVAARKGRATFTVRAEGRGAHAGGSHARGVNAIVALADVVRRLAALTDYSAGVTVNVGTIGGGTVNNRVPHEATATLEMRAFDEAAFARTRAAILDFHNTEGAARIRVTVEDECAPWPANPATENLVALWQTTGRELGLTVQREERGGLSDGNVLWSLFPTIDGLGPRGDNAHCSERSADGSKEPEWVDASSFAAKATLNARAISRLLDVSG